MLRTEEVEARIRDGILRGEHGPGERLVERDLVEKYGASRTVLREVLRNLNGAGLVSYVPNIGHSVQKFSPQDLTNIYDLIVLLEGYAFEIAWPLIDGSPEEIEYLVQLNNKMKDACKDGKYGAYRKDNDSFHARFVELANNTVLYETWRNLRTRHNSYPYLALMLPSSMDTFIESHDKIIACIRNKDAKGAKIELRNHMEFSKEVLVRAFANR